MTHPNHSTNGASLEDCHTNFYNLTHLSGIKWRKFVNGERPNASSDPLDDPILRSYSRCMQADILCVWRRIQTARPEPADLNTLSFDLTATTRVVHPPLSLAAGKELWIFWYGEEPDLTALVDAELLRIASNQSLWNGEWKTALSYECRSLLFKALHNLLERFVLTKDIVRFGKWFVQPSTSDERILNRSSQNISFSFTFFVHGDTVCATIDLREHPAVRPLTKEHLTEAAAAFATATNTATPTGTPNNDQTTATRSTLHGVNADDANAAGDGTKGGVGAKPAAVPRARRVMLAPFGLCGILTGNSYKANDPMALKILKDWTAFFPLCNKDNTDVPPVVEVIIGGHKTYHPSNYVLVTDLDDMEELEMLELQKCNAAAAANAAANSNNCGIPIAGAGPSPNSGEVLSVNSARRAMTTVVNQLAANSRSNNNINNNNANIMPMTNNSSSNNNKQPSFNQSNLNAVHIMRNNVLASKYPPYYDQRPTAGFTCNPANTHNPPTAAIEMPERAWQDSIMNPLHVAHVVNSVGIGSGSGSAQAAPISAANVGGTENVMSTDGERNTAASSSASVSSTSTTTTTASSGTATSSDNKHNTALQIQELQKKQRLQLWEFVEAVQKAPCICSKTLNATGGNTPHGTPQGGASTYSRNSMGDSMAVPSVGSPNTPAPSPHPNSTLSQPTSVPPADHQPPTPIDHLLDKNTPAPTPTDQHDNKSTTASPYVHQMPSVEAPLYNDGGPHSATGVGANTAMGAGASGPGSVTQPPSVERCTPGASSGGSSQPQQQQGTISVKKLEMQRATTPVAPHGRCDVKTEPGTTAGAAPLDTGSTNVTLSTSTASAEAKVALPQVINSSILPLVPGSLLSTATTTAAVSNVNRLLKRPRFGVEESAVKITNQYTIMKPNTYNFGRPHGTWEYYSVKRAKYDEGLHELCSPAKKNLYEGRAHSKASLLISPRTVAMDGNAALYVDPSMTRVGGCNNAAGQLPGSCGGGVSGASNVNRTGPVGLSGGSGMSAANVNSNGIDSASAMRVDRGMGPTNDPFYCGLAIKAEPGTTAVASVTSHSPNKEPKSSSAGGNLYTAEGLNPTFDDLEELFEVSPNDDCSSVQIHTPPASNNPLNGSCGTVTNTIDELKRTTGATGGLMSGNATISGAPTTTMHGEDIIMYPTPPSHDPHSGSSPPQNDMQMADVNTLDSMIGIMPSNKTVGAATSIGIGISVGSGSGSTAVMVKIKQECKLEVDSPLTDIARADEISSIVFHSQGEETFFGSTNYAPLTNLPSQQLPAIIALPKYKATWLSKKLARKSSSQQQQQQQQHQQQQQQQKQQQRQMQAHGQQQLQHHAQMHPHGLPHPQQQHLAHHMQQQHHQMQHQHQQHLHQQQLQKQQQMLHHQQQQQKHQQLHELLSAGPRTPIQQPRTPLGPIPSPMHSGGSTVPLPMNSGGSNLLLNQLNCPQAALTNQNQNQNSMQQMMQRTGMSPISPATAGAGPGLVPFPRGSPMMQQHRQTPIHPPPPYELAVASPATSTSSYLNKQYHSQEHPHTPQSVHSGHQMHMGGGSHGLHGGGNGGPYVGSGPMSGIGANGGSSGHAVVPNLPEVNSVLVNILLYDTSLNMFRDHNFDSSTVCVCNADSQKIGNIRGADSGIYVPLPGTSFNPAPVNHAGPNGMRTIGSGYSGSPLSGHPSSNSSSSTPASGGNQHVAGYLDEDPVDCFCGFSAVVNRRLSYRAGLFFEDEYEITGLFEDPGRMRQHPPLLSLVASLNPRIQPIKQEPNAENSNAQVEQITAAIFELLLEQCSTIRTNSNSVQRTVQRHRRFMSRARHGRSSVKVVGTISNALEYMDANDIILLALEHARLAFDCQRLDGSDFGLNHSYQGLHQQLSPYQANAAAMCLRQKLQLSRATAHKWPYISAGFTRSNKEIARMIQSLQPLLQNALQKSKARSAAGSKDATFEVTPLTWRLFHRLAGRASGQCEPQPIPSLIVGYDKDWLSVAPHSIHYWDKLLFEPYSYARDIVYMIICPDNEYTISTTRTYFRELSTTYEMCKLGRHTPMRGWADGMLAVGPRHSHDQKQQTTPLDDWLRGLNNAKLAEQIRCYAWAFLQQLAPFLNRIPGDKTLLNPPDSNNNTSSGASAGLASNLRNERNNTSSPMVGGGGNGNSNADGDIKPQHISPKLEPGTAVNNANSSGGNEQQQSGGNSGNSDMKIDSKSGDTKPELVIGDPLGVAEMLEDINPPAIVIYVVEPFSFGTDSLELERLSAVALLRCYAELMKLIPDSVRANMNIQIISLESIVELGPCGNHKRFSDEIKCVALNIFSKCRRNLVHAQTVKSLTGFGTAADMEAFLKTKDELNRRAFHMYTPPFVLAPARGRNDKADFSRAVLSMRGLNEQRHAVMYVNYCLSEDQSWLLATATDDRGEMLEKVCINISVPFRMRRRRVPARYVALRKLTDFVLGLISQTSHMWRIVIGRIGRIGHSELKSWSYLLSKSYLQKATKQFKDMCKQCMLMFPPTILSACLITLEPDAKLRVLPDQFTPDHRFSQFSMQNPLSTPQDVTCTHILVFPTSAVCASSSPQFSNEPQVDFDNDLLQLGGDEDENEGLTDNDLNELFWDASHMEMRSNHGSPNRIEDNRSWQSANGNNFKCTQPQDVEEVGSLNQQPLAVGYMVSTAPTGHMPTWFWSACPHLEDVCPVFLKSALHLHIPNIQTNDDILNTTNSHQSLNDHALDSSLTADVLRFVLEGYNNLSWLALDMNTHDRLSCLPVHVQALMDLYYLTASVI